MPRRPVRPQDRQRVARACDSCKSSKKRCDGLQPCRACEKRGGHDSCHYTPGRRHHPLPRRESTSTRTPHTELPQSTPGDCVPNNDVESSSTAWESNTMPPTAIHPPFDESAEHLETRDAIAGNSRSTSTEPLTQPPVMLASSSGDKGG